MSSTTSFCQRSVASYIVPGTSTDEGWRLSGRKIYSTGAPILKWYAVWAKTDESEVRVGLRPGSPDGLPIIGISQRAPGLVYATGHFRHGALLAPLTAELVTRIVHDPSAAVPAAMAPSRFDL